MVWGSFAVGDHLRRCTDHAFMIGFGFGFDSHWLKNWLESFKPIIKRSNCNHVLTYDSHLKTALNGIINRYSVIIFCPKISLPLYLNLMKSNHDLKCSLFL